MNAQNFDSHEFLGQRNSTMDRDMPYTQPTKDLILSPVILSLNADPEGRLSIAGCGQNIFIHFKTGNIFLK